MGVDEGFLVEDALVMLDESTLLVVLELDQIGGKEVIEGYTGVGVGIGDGLDVDVTPGPEPSHEML